MPKQVLECPIQWFLVFKYVKNKTWVREKASVSEWYYWLFRVCSLLLTNSLQTWCLKDVIVMFPTTKYCEVVASMNNSSYVIFLFLMNTFRSHVKNFPSIAMFSYIYFFFLQIQNLFRVDDELNSFVVGQRISPL